MEKKFLEILDKWANYSKYDRNQKCFNLNSYEYKFHSANKQIEKILSDYDESGVLAILIAKKIFTEFTKEVRIKFSDFLENPNDLKDDIEMYNLFHSDVVKEAEDYYLNIIENLSLKIIGKNLIGKEDRESKKTFLFSCTDKVINNLNKCRLDVYQKGGKINNITKISTHIQIFPSLANCLLTLNKAQDGMYLCYINIHNSPDSYFGFYIKNNGNIFSINERINEQYKGSHQYSRNGRWTENKADEIFPYEYIFSYGEHDYKGYATDYKIDENKLSFFDLTEEVYTPILLAMIMIVKKYQGKDLSNEPIMYVDSLLPINLNSITSDKKELAIIEKCALVENHKKLNLNFEINKILDGTYDKEFTNKNLEYGAKFSSKNTGQFFIDLWGEGFTFDINKLYEIQTQKALTDNNESYFVEFVGSEMRQKAQGYYIIRQELAEYIRKQMRIEFEKNGGISFYEKWFKDSIYKNLEKIERIAIDKYIAIQNGEKILRYGWHSSDENILTDIYYIEDTCPSGFYYYYMLNDKEPYKSIYYDMKNNKKCNMFFAFQPKSYKGLEDLFGEVPKLIKGWNLFTHRRTGNAILDLTDAVEAVGTPFENDESQYYYSDLPYEKKPFKNFGFIIGYSKSGFKQRAKELGINLNTSIKVNENTDVSTNLI